MTRKEHKYPSQEAKIAALQLTDADRQPVRCVTVDSLEQMKEYFPHAKWIDRAITHRPSVAEDLLAAQSDDSAETS
jgi:hypothetical protein